MATIKDVKRMCKEHSKCGGCPFIDFDCCEPDHFPDNADEIADKWVAEHPVKTYAMDFFEKFPNAPRSSDGVPKICWVYAYGDRVNCSPRGCANCWNQEMKEDE